MKQLYSHTLTPPYLLQLIIAVNFKKALSFNRIIKIILLLILLNIPYLSSAANFTTVKSGNWSDPSTWSSAQGATAIPGVNDNVTVTENIILTITAANKTAICNVLRLEPASSGNKNGASLIINGTLQVSTFEQINVASKKKVPDLYIASTGHLKISGAFDMGASTSGFVSYTFENGSTVEYNGAGSSQQVEARFNFKNLIVSGNGTKTFNVPLIVEENLTISGPVTISASPSSMPNATHTITGSFTVNLNSVFNLEAATLHITNDFINNGTTNGNTGRIIVDGNWVNNTVNFVPNTSTVELTGISTAQINIGGAASTAFNVLTVAKEALMSSDITINSTLSLSNGKLNTGTGNNSADYKLLTLGPTANIVTTETNTTYIKGRLASQRTIPIAPSVQNFGNIGFNMTRNNVDPGTIRVERVTGLTLSNGSDQSVPRYYDVQRVSAGDITGLSLTNSFSFLASEFAPSTTIDDYVLVRETIPGNFTRPSFSKVNSTTVQNVHDGQFSRYTLANRMAPLPVELIKFTAIQENSEVVLSWHTAWEMNNHGFEVQVSKTGNTFTKIAFVASLASGNANGGSYTYKHTDIEDTGRLYYRLVQHDHDGAVTYSNIVVTEFVKEGRVKIYPNPFIENLNIELPTSGPYNMVLTNHLGKVVYSTTSTLSINKINLDSSLPNGIYFLKIYKEGKTVIQKLIKS
jgi:hypothetical protein